VAEVQALIDPTTPGTARRVTNGLDASRVAMALAVLERRAGVGLRAHDAYVATVGGVKISEPAADLAIVLAVATGLTGVPLEIGTVAVGEVGLAGEVRRTTGLTRRLAEAARLGFTRALVPPDSGRAPAGMSLIEVATVNDALALVIAE